MEPLSEAICFAAAAFDGMIRKAEKHPAILHSLEAAAIAQTVTEEKEVAIAAVLHDTVEDAGIELAEIRDRFGERVAELVASETEDKRDRQNPQDTWKERKEEALCLLRQTDDAGVKALYLGDKLSNIRSLYRLKRALGSDVWNLFNQRDPHAHQWYYRGIAEALGELKRFSAYEEFVMLIDKTFEED